MAGTELLRLANLQLMEVAVEVNENDINNVSLNDTAIVEVDAFLGESTKVLFRNCQFGQCSRVSADQVTNFEVKVRIWMRYLFDQAWQPLSKYKRNVSMYSLCLYKP